MRFCVSAFDAYINVSILGEESDMMETLAAILLFAASCICSVRIRFVQFRRLGLSVRSLGAGNRAEGGVSPFAACATSLAATLGTGNIAGVAGAIVLGGPGAIFWMWMSALAGMGTKYLDIYYGMRFRRPDCIGPMAYMESGLHKRLRPTAYLYASLCAVGCLCMGNLVQINAMAEAGGMLMRALNAEAAQRLLPLMLGVLSAVFVGCVQLGGAKRVGEAASLLVPAMSALYIGAALFVLAVNIDGLHGALTSIFAGALEPRAILTGIARGTFTHEAGLGTAAIAHAGSDAKDAHKQALFGVFEVFFDTIVMCTITALAVLSAIPDAVLRMGAGQNSTVVITAFSTVFGEQAAAWCVTLSLMLFALSSILTFSHYGGVCARYLFGKKGGRAYLLLYLALLSVGGTIDAALVWDAAQWVNIAMGLTNMFALLLLTGKARVKAAQSDTG